MVPRALPSPAPLRTELRGWWAAAALVGCAVLAGCAGGRELSRDGLAEVSLRLDGPADFAEWMHSPLRPDNGEALEFRVDFTSQLPLATAELYVYEYELTADRDGLPGQRARRRGVWGLRRTFDLTGRQGRVRLRDTLAAGFPAHTRVEYVWRVTDVHGGVTDRIALFDAGESPWPQDKVLVYAASRAPMRDLIDISFFRDVDYGDSLALFNADVEAMVTEGFFGSEAFGRNREHWAFYTTDRAADGLAISEDVTNTALLPAFLKDGSVPGVDAFCLLHREPYTDRSLLVENFHALSNNMFSAEAYNFGTAVHECGHAIFHLSDEYGGCACFQTHASSNVFRERADCARWNAENGFPAADCYEIRDVYDRDWYSAEEPTFFATEAACADFNERTGRSADSCRSFYDLAGVKQYWAFEATCIMHDDGDDVVRPFQRACARVIDDYFDRFAGARPGAELAYGARANIYGYEPVVYVDLVRGSDGYAVEVVGSGYGVPAATSADDGAEVALEVIGDGGEIIADYGLVRPGAVHAHAPAEGGGAPAASASALPASGSARIVIAGGARYVRIADGDGAADAAVALDTVRDIHSVHTAH